MQLRPLQFEEAAKCLEPVLAGLPPKVIAVDRVIPFWEALPPLPAAWPGEFSMLSQGTSTA
jgi:hypothetical protein